MDPASGRGARGAVDAGRVTGGRVAGRSYRVVEQSLRRGRAGAGGGRAARVPPGRARRDTATRRAGDEPDPHEERLHPRLDGPGPLPAPGGEGAEPHRSPVEADEDRVEHGPVEPVEAAVVDV